MGDLARLENEQRKAAYKAEMAATQRVNYFDPRLPASGRTLDARNSYDDLLDRIAADAEKAEREELFRQKQALRDAELADQEMTKKLTRQEKAQMDVEVMDAVYGPDWRTRVEAGEEVRAPGTPLTPEFEQAGMVEPLTDKGGNPIPGTEQTFKTPATHL